MSAFTANTVDPKHPSESTIYTRDWSDDLNDGATVSTSDWTVQNDAKNLREMHRHAPR